MIKRVLIAYDDSPAADEAVDDLKHAGLPADLEATVISVADVYLPPEPAVSKGTPTEVPPMLVQKARDKAVQAVNAHRALAERGCARVRALFPTWKCAPLAMADSPGWAIAAKAKEVGADLVVLGAQSHSRLERMFLGSVSHKVAAEAPCSVRIGRHRPVSKTLDILVAVDGSIDSKAALREVASRTWPTGARFHLVTVVDTHLETAMAWPGFAAEAFAQTADQSGREWVNRMTESAARILFDAGLEVSNYQYDGHPKDILISLAEEWSVHSIFMGARGLQHGRHASLGTVASAVASRARCSVELVRARD